MTTHRLLCNFVVCVPESQAADYEAVSPGHVVTHPDAVRGLTPKLNWMFDHLADVDGYNCAEAASAMQKCIRRGLEEDALFWATELDRSNFGSYVFKRLRIIASEDIGLADPQAVLVIRALSDNWLEQRKKDDSRHAPERLFLVHAVQYLCRAPKSRSVDHALVVFYEGPRPKREVPDFALDKHTGRGRARKRGWAHWWSDGCLLIRGGDVDYEERARAIRIDAQTEMNLD